MHDDKDLVIEWMATRLDSIIDHFGWRNELPTHLVDVAAPIVGDDPQG